jgi:diguanylate cyclase (GGDEF)-like protein
MRTNRVLRVLVVEDDVVDRLALKRAFEAARLPYETTFATTVAEACAFLVERAFDVIVTDHDLGGGTAVDVLEAAGDVPAVIVTGAGDELVAVRGMKAGAYDYIVKDHDRAYLQLLPVALENALAHKEVEREKRRMQDDLRRVNAELERSRAALAELVIRDDLTGLVNRRELDRLLAIETHRSRRYGGPVALVMIDIDHFKRVNDGHGHAAGDVVLRQVGRLLAGEARSCDVAARYGGEELAVILPVTDATGAAAFAERVRARIASARFIVSPAGGPDVVLTVTASFGVAAIPEDADSESELLRSADVALYAAKRGGRNRVATADGAVGRCSRPSGPAPSIA